MTLNGKALLNIAALLTTVTFIDSAQAQLVRVPPRTNPQTHQRYQNMISLNDALSNSPVSDTPQGQVEEMRRQLRAEQVQRQIDEWKREEDAKRSLQDQKNLEKGRELYRTDPAFRQKVDRSIQEMNRQRSISEKTNDMLEQQKPKGPTIEGDPYPETTRRTYKYYGHGHGYSR